MAKKNKKRTGYVYVLSNPCVRSRKGKAVFKVGFANDMPKRLGTLNTGAPENFKVVALFKTNKYDELEKFTREYLHSALKTEDGSPTEFYEEKLDYLVKRIEKCAKDHHYVLEKKDGSIYVGRSAVAIRHNLKRFSNGGWKNVNQLAKALVKRFTPGKTIGGVIQLLTGFRSCKKGPWRDRLQSIGLRFNRVGRVVDWRKAKVW